MDPERMSQKRFKKREAMLDAAMSIVLDQGVDELTIAALAGSLSLSVGALYRYFDGKETIMVELQKRALLRFHDRLKQDVERAQVWGQDQGLDSRDARLLELVCAAHVFNRDDTRHTGEHHLMRAIMNTPDEVLSLKDAIDVDLLIQPLLATIIETIEAVVEQGILEPSDTLMRSYTFWAVVQGTDTFIKRDRFQPPEYHAVHIISYAVSTLLYGWGAQREDVEKAYMHMGQLFNS